MVVITGKYKGKRLKTVDDNNLRPTLARVKESLFSIIQWDIAGKKCLDCFAGSGALGIEMLSRGAEEVVFIDNKHHRLVLENLANCKATARVLNTDYAVSLQRLAGERFGLIIADPPYDFSESVNFFTLLKELKLVDDNTIIVYEHLYSKPLSVPEGFEIYDSRKYGIVALSFVRLI